MKSYQGCKGCNSSVACITTDYCLKCMAEGKCNKAKPKDVWVKPGEWAAIGIISIVAFLFVFGCSDDTTIVNHKPHNPEISRIECDFPGCAVWHGDCSNKFKPFQSKDCQDVIDSLEMLLEECQK